ncbi:hypothetical protein [Microbispora sp. CA-102843]|uniref:hypothetical protein n=1 Tax=Microbispora sp. CA-102843 TaxID=3239952 RepID=UPI003D8C15CE
MRHALARAALALTSLVCCGACGATSAAALGSRPDGSPQAAVSSGMPSLPAPASGSASGSASDSAGTVSSPVDCRTGPRVPAGETGPWTHPAQSFYGPSDKDRPTRASLEHLLVADNAVVIEYSPRLPEASIQALREWTYLQTATVAVPGGREPALRATTASTELTCDGVDTIRLSALAGTRTFGRVAEHGDADEN